MIVSVKTSITLRGLGKGEVLAEGTYTPPLVAVRAEYLGERAQISNLTITSATGMDVTVYANDRQLAKLRNLLIAKGELHYGS